MDNALVQELKRGQAFDALKMATRLENSRFIARHVVKPLKIWTFIRNPISPFLISSTRPKAP
jgi:hypothetical protein